MSEDNFNYLVIENVKDIPFPKETLEIVKKINWEEETWLAAGLPGKNNKFCVSNDVLYFEQDEKGEINLEKIEFTGEVLFCVVLTNNEKGKDSYSITFKGIFYKGLLCEIKLTEFNVQTYEEFIKKYEDFSKKADKKKKILNSKWYKYIYLPYYNLLKNFMLCSFWILDKITAILIKLFSLLTPIEPE